jgi:hypothetical protein
MIHEGNEYNYWAFGFNKAKVFDEVDSDKPSTDREMVG